MISRAPIDRHRIRRITGSFSWLDHRLLSGGFLADMTPAEMLLYFFLVLVGDKNGISFYGYEKICTLLKMDLDRLLWARDRLVDKSLIACQSGRYQVLQLPERPLQTALQRPGQGPSSPARTLDGPEERAADGNTGPSADRGEPRSLATIFQQLAQR